MMILLVSGGDRSEPPYYLQKHILAEITTSEKCGYRPKDLNSKKSILFYNFANYYD